MPFNDRLERQQSAIPFIYATVRLAVPIRRLPPCTVWKKILKIWPRKEQNYNRGITRKLNVLRCSNQILCVTRHGRTRRKCQWQTERTRLYTLYTEDRFVRAKWRISYCQTFASPLRLPNINNHRFIRHAAIVSKYIVEGVLDGMQRGNAQTITEFRREPIPIARV